MTDRNEFAADRKRSGLGGKRGNTRNSGRREKRPPKPLNETRMKDLALFYVGRYATTAHKLKMYLARKVRERGWEGERPADIDALVERFAELKYIDDATFAAQKAASLTARGYGERRVGEALYAAGISERDGVEARENAEAAALESAVKMARKRRFGPFARDPAPPEKRQKQVQAMLRGGHDFTLSRKIVFADSIEQLGEIEVGGETIEDMDLWLE